MSGPHADFVTSVLSEIELAAEFFRLTLRQEICERIDLTTLRLEDGSFIDEQNRPYYRDLLFSVERKTGGAIAFYLLFEHKSHPDHSVLDQLAVYLALIYRKQGRGLKPPVLPVVFYHGQAPWAVPLRFQDQLDFFEDDVDVLGSDVMNFQYTLVNVRETSIDELEASIRQKAFWWTLARIWELKSADKLRAFFDRVAGYYHESPEEFLGKLLAYILRVQDIELVELETMMRRAISARKVNTAMGTLDKMEAKARQEGKIEGKLEAARNLLARGVSLEIILESMDLTRDQLRETGILDK